MIAKGRHVTRVGKRNQVTIPVELLRRMGVQPGEKVEVRLGDDGDIHVSRPDDALAKFVGCLARPGQPTFTNEELVQLVKDARKARAAAAEARYLRTLNRGD